MNKNEVRELIGQQKYGMGAAILEANTTLVIRRLKSDPCFLNASKIGAFAPVPDQPDVSLVMSDPERTFFIPALDESTGEYRLARMGETFKKSLACGLEPVDPEFVEPEDVELILIPGVAFDEQGNRIGPEKDPYTSLLKAYPDAIHAAIAYDCQFMKELPIDEDDAKMDILLTEAQRLDFRAD